MLRTSCHFKSIRLEGILYVPVSCVSFSVHRRPESVNIAKWGIFKTFFFFLMNNSTYFKNTFLAHLSRYCLSLEIQMQIKDS